MLRSGFGKELCSLVHPSWQAGGQVSTAEALGKPEGG